MKRCKTVQLRARKLQRLSIRSLEADFDLSTIKTKAIRFAPETPETVLSPGVSARARPSFRERAVRGLVTRANPDTQFAAGVTTVDSFSSRYNPRIAGELWENLAFLVLWGCALAASLLAVGFALIR